MKLKYHRLKPGGVGARGRDVSSYEIELPPAKARGVVLRDNMLVQRNVDWLRDAFDYKC